MRLTATIGMNIIEITRTNPSEMKGKLFWDYCILFDSGEITFTSSGYHQKTQAEPKTGWGRQYNYRSLEKHDINFD
jgi:hypothetical protein